MLDRLLTGYVEPSCVSAAGRVIQGAGVGPPFAGKRSRFACSSAKAVMAFKVVPKGSLSFLKICKLRECFG